MDTNENKFGTFAGVFTPSILTILGAIMFLRAGYVIGQTGISNTILILLIAQAISLLTALSMSAVATNTPVAGGGAYFLISRALGPQFGGAIGLALYLAQALSVPFYVLAFTNALVQSAPALAQWFVPIALGTAVILFIINLISTQAAIRSQYLVMVMLTLAILVFMMGSLTRFDINILRTNLGSGYTDGISFWIVFAIYFPAVTGILAGVNMSGDLKNPAQSLVRGTMAAMAVGFTVYLLEIVLCGGSQSRADLISHPYEMLIQNAWLNTGFLVMAGAYCAMLSSAIGSLMGAPRVLQALARDRVLRGLGLFARSSGNRDEPRAALILTMLITLAVIGLASGKDAMAAFDMIASIVAMFFLCTYGMINLAAFVESFGGNPSFRPRFRLYHWSTSFLGFLACAVVMTLIDAKAAMVAVLVILILYVLISRRVFSSAFGDARRGFQYSLVVRSLQKLRNMDLHPKNWRPSFLVMGGASAARLPMIKYANWMEGGRGLMTVAQVVSGDLETFAGRAESMRSATESVLKDNDLQAFTEIVFAEDVDAGMRILVQAHSIGPLKPNTVVLGWPHTEERALAVYRHVRGIAALGKSVVLVSDRALPAPKTDPHCIDIWWRGQANGSLMITLAYLLTQNWEWRNSEIRILRLIPDDAGRESSRQVLEELIHSARIPAQACVIVSSDPFSEVLQSHSAQADLVFLGLPYQDDEHVIINYRHLNLMLENMPTSILVRSSGEADFSA
jgi:amino acid transporter